jgi:LysM repeat protein
VDRNKLIAYVNKAVVAYVSSKLPAYVAPPAPLSAGYHNAEETRIYQEQTKAYQAYIKVATKVVIDAVQKIQLQMGSTSGQKEAALAFINQWNKDPFPPFITTTQPPTTTVAPLAETARTGGTGVTVETVGTGVGTQTTGQTTAGTTASSGSNIFNGSLFTGDSGISATASGGGVASSTGTITSDGGSSSSAGTAGTGAGMQATGQTAATTAGAQTTGQTAAGTTATTASGNQSGNSSTVSTGTQGGSSGSLASSSASSSSGGGSSGGSGSSSTVATGAQGGSSASSESQVTPRGEQGQTAGSVSWGGGGVSTFGSVSQMAQGLQMPGSNNNFQGLKMPAGYPASEGGAGLQMPENFQAPAVAGESTSSTYKVKKGDTLWAIAKKYYGDGKKWRKILEANTGKVKSPKTLKIGTDLVIPKL